MHKLSSWAVTTLAAGTLSLGNLAAQQTPATTAKPATKSTSSAQSTSKPRASTAAKTAKPVTLTTEKEKLSYALGMSIGKGMQRDSVEIDPNILAQGLKDVLNGGKLLLTDAQAQEVLTHFRTEMAAKKEAEAKRVSDANKQAGTEFLAANKTKEGVVTLPSGLQYKVLKEGTGPKPTASDTVVCNYRGTLINGTEFDSSYKRGEPATFPVSGVIKGWTEALQLMPAGSKWQLFIPAGLAYGERSPGAEIGPNSTLIFEIELLSIKGKDEVK